MISAVAVKWVQRKKKPIDYGFDQKPAETEYESPKALTSESDSDDVNS
jgi:hypothetical protein